MVVVKSDCCKKKGLPHCAVMCSLCVLVCEDASAPEHRAASENTDVFDKPYLSLSEFCFCSRWWHLSVSVTKQFALVFHAARQIDLPQSSSASEDSQTALIGKNKSICIHCSC